MALYSHGPPGRAARRPAAAAANGGVAAPARAEGVACNSGVGCL